MKFRWPFPKWWLIPVGGVLFFAWLVHAFRVQHVDVTRSPQHRGLQGRCVVLVQDAVVLKYAEHDGARVTLECVGENALVPTSLSDYEAHPRDWNRSPEYLAKWTKPLDRPPQVLAVVKKGTQLRVVRLVEEQNPEAGTFLQVFVAGVGEFEHQAPDAGELFGPGEGKRLKSCSVE
jgi:hypothetical protein